VPAEGRLIWPVDRLFANIAVFVNHGQSIMKVTVALLAVATITASGAALADAGEDLLKKSGCTACHAIDKKVIGPAYQDVAAKYKGDAGAATKLADKVKKGGSGVWGPVPMPPNTQVSDADIKTMVAYVLALKK
jgi:cytochrome c